jgi:TetR/AcrR family transcriptional regulator, regulator of cefoperazone and chloramphenicol sensitivity
VLFPRNVPVAEPTNEDRIRDAALATFAAHGIAATSFRMVAEAAGVSIGLVQHYFKSKAALIAAVDDHVLEVVGLTMDSGPLPTGRDDILTEAGHRMTTLIAENAIVLEYAARSLVENEAIGSVIFDGLLAVSIAQRDHFMEHKLTREDLDPEWSALNPLILRIGAIMLRPHIERYLGRSFVDPTQLKRWDSAVTNLIREGQLRRNPPPASQETNDTS